MHIPTDRIIHTSRGALAGESDDCTPPKYEELSNTLILLTLRVGDPSSRYTNRSNMCDLCG